MNGSSTAGFFIAQMLLLGLTEPLGAQGSFIVPNGCICPGSVLLFECTVFSGIRGSTVWQGSAFDCAREEILLRHSQFHLGTAIGQCNDGAIIGRGIQDTESGFTSQLNVTFTSNLNGKTVECIYDNGTTNIIGNTTFNINTDYIPPPGNIHVSSISSEQLTFQWNSPSNSCSDMTYSITASSCGICPSDTSHKSVTCRITNDIISTSSLTCVLSVATRVCGNLVGNFSLPVYAFLKVPASPVVTTIPHYANLSGSLIAIVVKFNESDTFNVSNGIDGSTISYTVIYSDSISGSICSLIIIPATLCGDRVCSHMFEVSLSSCSHDSNINVTTFATNILGDGPRSEPVTVEKTNCYVKVTMTVNELPLRHIKCSYLNPQANNIKSCHISYWPNGTYGDLSYATGQQFTNNSIDIDLPPFPKFYNETLFLYRVTANDGRVSVIVEGAFHAACSPTALSNHMAQLDNTTCDAPFLTVGVVDGIACYRDTNVGSSALHYCLNCGFNRIVGATVRTCLANGSWSGSIPDCSCYQTITNLKSNNDSNHNINMEIIVTITCLFMLLITAITTSFTIAMAIIIRDKLKIKMELKQAIADKEKFCTEIYEDIDSNRAASSLVDTDSNIAYSHTTQQH